MYDVSLDSAGNILDQQPVVEGVPPPPMPGRTWVVSIIQRDVLLEYFNGESWALKDTLYGEDAAWSIWDGSAWVVSPLLKDKHLIDTMLALRNIRGNLLKDSDWTQLSDSPLSDSKKAEWAAYRQVLRDFPGNNAGFSKVSLLTWPTEPT